jgi:hypothetical protein
MLEADSMFSADQLVIQDVACWEHVIKWQHKMFSADNMLSANNTKWCQLITCYQLIKQNVQNMSIILSCIKVYEKNTRDNKEN